MSWETLEVLSRGDEDQEAENPLTAGYMEGVLLEEISQKIRTWENKYPSMELRLIYKWNAFGWGVELNRWELQGKPKE